MKCAISLEGVRTGWRHYLLTTLYVGAKSCFSPKQMQEIGRKMMEQTDVRKFHARSLSREMKGSSLCRIVFSAPIKLLSSVATFTSLNFLEIGFCASCSAVGERTSFPSPYDMYQKVTPQIDHSVDLIWQGRDYESLNRSFTRLSLIDIERRCLNLKESAKLCVLPRLQFS
jgi:hypothetical protein